MKEGIYEELVRELVFRQKQEVDRTSFYQYSLEIIYLQNKFEIEHT